MDPGNPILTKVVHEELTGEGVANFMTLPKDVSPSIHYHYFDADHADVDDRDRVC